MLPQVRPPPKKVSEVTAWYADKRERLTELQRLVSLAKGERHHLNASSRLLQHSLRQVQLLELSFSRARICCIVPDMSYSKVNGSNGGSFSTRNSYDSGGRASKPEAEEEGILVEVFETTCGTCYSGSMPHSIGKLCMQMNNCDIKLGAHTCLLLLPLARERSLADPSDALWIHIAGNPYSMGQIWDSLTRPVEHSLCGGIANNWNPREEEQTEQEPMFFSMSTRGVKASVCGQKVLKRWSCRLHLKLHLFEGKSAFPSAQTAGDDEPRALRHYLQIFPSAALVEVNHESLL